MILTRREQLLVAFVLAAFVTGVGVKHVRAMHAIAPITSEADGK